MTIDYAKIKRQLLAACRQSHNPHRVKLADHLGRVYERLEAGEMNGARKFLDAFDTQAKELGWEGGGAAFPRPFNKTYLERLYWQASKLAGRGGQPRRSGGKPKTIPWWEH